MTNAKPLDVLQKRAIRLINKVNVREHTNRLFISSNTLKFENYVDLKTLVMFKAGVCHLILYQQ